MIKNEEEILGERQGRIMFYKSLNEDEQYYLNMIYSFIFRFVLIDHATIF